MDLQGDSQITRLLRQFRAILPLPSYLISGSIEECAIIHKRAIGPSHH
jgi:hypothetical protein